MTRTYRKFDVDFKAGAVQLVEQTGKPIAQVARDLGINEGTLSQVWVDQIGMVEKGRTEAGTFTRRSGSPASRSHSSSCRSN